MLSLIINIIKRKFIFTNYSNKKYLILESLNSEILTRYLGKKNTEIISLRDEINFFLILKLIFKLKKINQLNYYLETINQVNPQKIITNIDSNINFYKLKKYYPKKIFISIQNGVRIDNIFRNDKNLKCDKIFCHGFKDINFYKKSIKASVIPIGSLKNNLIKNDLKKERNTISYISQYRGTDENTIISHFLGKKFSKITWGDYIKSEKKLIYLLYKICKKKKIKLNIVGVSYDFLKEKKWYYDILKSKNFKFVKRKNKTSSYKFLKYSEIIICMHSTLGYEFFARGKKVLFFSRNVKNIAEINNKIKFGFPYIKNTDGFFYSNKISEDQIAKLIDNLKKTSKSIWLKKIKEIRKNIMIYDYKNNILRKNLIS